MTPDFPPPSEGSPLPARHRPNKGNLAKDTTEQDLWAFDDIDAPDDETAGVPRKSSQGIPAPRDAENMATRRLDAPNLPAPGDTKDSIRVDVNKTIPKLQTGILQGQSKPGRDFDDLDRWDGPPVVDSAPASPAASQPVPPRLTIAAVPAPASPPADEENEFSPPLRTPATPVLPRPRLNLSKVERIGLVVLSAFLLIGGALIFFNTISRLPTETGRVAANDFPIQGKHLTIVSADSFWRAPKSADTVRRGTQLIPVIDLTSSGGPAAIRVFFRNSDGDVIGDAVNRFLQPGAKIQIPATAGFDDVGMHAAYRTGENKPWTIEVLEAPTENAAGPDFRKLFVIDISTDRR